MGTMRSVSRNFRARRLNSRSACGCRMCCIATIGRSALVPVLLRTQYANDPNVRSLPVVLTIHNVVYQGLFPSAVMRQIGLPDRLFTIDGLEFFGGVNYLKGGIEFADYLTTVSRRYAKEIQTPEYGCGSRRSDPQSGGSSGRNTQRRGLFHLESGSGHRSSRRTIRSTISMARKPARRIYWKLPGCPRRTWVAR